jgi:hypothetical protein
MPPVLAAGPAVAPEPLEESAFRAQLPADGPRRLFDHWASLRAGAVMPDYGRIDPIGMPRDLLPALYIVAAEPDGGFRFRLSGTGLRTVFNADITGKRLEQVLDGRDLENARRSYRRVAEAAAPWYSRVDYDTDASGLFRYHRLTLPLGPGPVPARLLGGLFVHADGVVPEDFAEVFARGALTAVQRYEAVMAV